MVGRARRQEPEQRLRVGIGLFATLIAASCGFPAVAQKPKPPKKNAATPAPKVEVSREDSEFFENKIRPLLADNCFTCHAAANKTAMGGLQLDSRAKLLKGGGRGTALVPGKPEASLLLRAISHTDPKLQMPPNNKLNSEQIAALTEWVKRGAPWPAVKAAASTGFNVKARAGHWAYQPLKKVALPGTGKIKNQKSKIKNPIDVFLLAKLREKKLKPAPLADKRTLIRRVTFDLTGLPPTPEEISAFLNDKSLNAYEKVVERLLASPHYGERWARHWLDLVRYAETDGHEFDFEKPGAYEYRDYVIRAFNADVPYDQFVKEHIAGDLLPKPRRHPTEKFNESLLGTGFWWLGEGKHSPVDLQVDEGEHVDNQIDVFGKTFLAQTLACARCHDHKFDAISTKDYYALSGIIKSSRYQVANLVGSERLQPKVQQLKELSRQLRSELAKTATEQKRQGLGDSNIQQRILDGAEKKPQDPLHAWAVLTKEDTNRSPEVFATRRTELLKTLRERTETAQKARERVVVFEDFSKPTYTGWYVSGEAFGSSPVSTATQWMDGKAVNVIGASMADSGSISEKLEGALRSKTFPLTKNFVLFRFTGNGGQVRLIIDGFQRIMAPIYGGLKLGANSPVDMRWYAMDVSKWVGHRAYIELLDTGSARLMVDEIVFSDSPGLPEAPNPLIITLLDDPVLNSPASLTQKYLKLYDETLQLWASGQLETARDAGPRLELVARLLENTAIWKPLSPSPTESALLEQYQKIEAELPAIRPIMAAVDGTGADDRVHLRGSYKTLGEVAPRGFLEVFASPSLSSVQDKGTLRLASALSVREKKPMEPGGKSDCGRLELAQSLTTNAAPLLARVMVNRLWHHHFGAGLVRTTDDFGLMGERPSHPELLDWLAGELMREGWSLKKIHRKMVLSQAYQRVSHSDVKTEEADPQNRLLHRMNIRRLTAEEVRDTILAVSGRLDKTLYGPSVMPYLTQFMEGRGRPSSSGPLDGNGRRSLYIGVRRNFLTPFFLAFDYPVPFSTMGRRTVSNVPAQALALMNNPLVVEQATVWAKRVLSQPGSASEHITGMYETAFGRTPTKAEQEDALAFLAAGEKESGKSEAPDAWAELCHVLFNLKEFIYIH